jgi:iron complex transport system ATP-binding protein
VIAPPTGHPDLASDDPTPSTAAAAPILEARGVTVAYRGRQALIEADLAIASGTRLAILGPNGAGKSSLLRALVGTRKPTAGSIRLCGDEIGSLDPKAVARTIAVVPEVAGLPFQMHVEELVGLGRLPHDPPLLGLRPTDEAAVAGALERVGIANLRQRDVRELSAGERQLVFVALAIAQGAPILVLDEPTAHLDIRHQVEVMELLVDLNERDGTTVIAVLHDLALAAHFFPRIALLDQGRIVADGPPAETMEPRRIREVFGVDPTLFGLRAPTESA